jgi:hypothetical protein
MATRDDTIKKLRSLLNRNGRSDAEADTAQMLAAALAEKHGIDLAELDLTDPARPTIITHKKVGEWSRLPDEALYASLICKRWFEVLPVTESNGITQRMQFIGTDLHIEIAEYVFQFLVGEFRRCWNRRRSRTKKRKTFIFGAYCALRSKLEERFSPDSSPSARTDLAISWKAKRTEYLKTHFAGAYSTGVAPKEKRSVALHAGFAAGRDIEIRPGVNGTPGRPGLPAPQKLIGG